MAKNREILFLLKMKNAARQVMNQLGGDWRKIGAEAKRAKQETDGAGKATDALANRRQKLTGIAAALADIRKRLTDIKREAGDAGSGLSGFAAAASRALTAVSAVFGAASLGGSVVRTYAEFEKQMDSVLAASGATEAEFQNLTQAAKDAGMATEFSATEAAQGLDNLVRAGFSASQAVTALPDTLDLATAGAISMADATDIVSNTLRAFQLDVADTTRVADTLATVNSATNAAISDLGEGMKYVAPIAANLGVSLEDATAALGVLSDSGIKGSMAGTSARMALLRGNVVALGQAGDKAAEALKRLGIAPDKLDPQKVGLVGMLRALKAANASTADLAALFGVEASTGVAVMINNVDRLEQVSRQAADGLGTAAKQAGVMRDNLATDWGKLLSALKGLAIEVGEAVAPALRLIVQFATAVVQALQGAEITVDRFETAAIVLVTTVKALAVAFALSTAKSLIFSPVVSALGKAAAIAATGLGGVVVAASRMVFTGVIGAASLFSSALTAVASSALAASRALAALAFRGLVGAIATVLAPLASLQLALLGVASALRAIVVGATLGALSSLAGGFRALTGAATTAALAVRAFPAAALQAALFAVANPLTFLRGAFGVLAASVTSAGGVLRLLVSVALSPLRVALMAASVALRALWAVFAMNPIGAVVAAVTLLVLAYNRWKDVTFEIGGRTTALGDIVTAVMARMKAVISAVASLWPKVRDAATSAFAGIGQGVSALAGVIKSGVNLYIGLYVGAFKAIVAAWDNLPAALEAIGVAAGNLLIDALQVTINAVLGGIRKLFAGLDSIAGTNLAGNITDVDMSSWKMKASSEAKDAGEAIRGAFNEGLNADYVGAATEVLDQAIGNTFGGLLDEAANITRQRIRSEVEATKDDGMTNPLAPQGRLPKTVDPDTDTGTGGGTGGSGGGGGKSAKAKEVETVDKLMGELLKKYQDEIALAGFAGRELELQKAVLDAQNAAKEKGLTLTQKELDLIRASAGQAIDVSLQTENIREYGDVFKDSLSSGLKEALDQGKLSFKSFVSDIGKKLRDTAIDNFTDVLFNGNGKGGGITNWLTGLFGKTGGGAGGGGFLSGLFGSGGFLSGLFGGLFRDGGVMTSFGSVPLRKYRDGGITREPQLAMFGEGSSPEAYVPVPSGRIPVTLSGGGGGVTNQNINIHVQTRDANSFGRSQAQIAAETALAIRRQSKRNN